MTNGNKTKNLKKLSTHWYLCLSCLHVTSSHLIVFVCSSARRESPFILLSYFLSTSLTPSDSLPLILSSSWGLTIFEFITILVAVLLTSAAKFYSSPPPCFLSSPSTPSSQVFEDFIIYLFINSFFFTFNDFFPLCRV